MNENKLKQANVLYELAVIYGTIDSYTITHDTTLTDDVIGFLDDNEVYELLMEIKTLGEEI